MMENGDHRQNYIKQKLQDLEELNEICTFHRDNASLRL